jgi:DNA-binding NarL/FixJ family response regulator
LVRQWTISQPVATAGLASAPRRPPDGRSPSPCTTRTAGHAIRRPVSSTGCPARIASFAPAIAAKTAGLKPREFEVLKLLARRLSNKEIARRLVISPKTVANHAEHIYSKIDASTRAAAGLFAMRHGLLPEEESLADFIA